MAVAALVVDVVMAVAALVVMVVAALVVEGLMVAAVLDVILAALLVGVVEVVGCRVAAADCHQMRSRQNCNRSIGQSHVAAFLTLSVWIKFGLAFSELIFGD